MTLYADMGCRHQILADAYTAMVTEGTTSGVRRSETEIEESARTVTRAGW
ncbi:MULTISPECIES: hypothetical protein [Streptomyces]